MDNNLYLLCKNHSNLSFAFTYKLKKQNPLRTSNIVRRWGFKAAVRGLSANLPGRAWLGYKVND